MFRSAVVFFLKMSRHTDYKTETHAAVCETDCTATARRCCGIFRDSGAAYKNCRLTYLLTASSVASKEYFKYWLCNVPTVSAASGRYRLRSTGSATYVLPRTRTKFGERGFFYSGPAAWNTLPSDLHDITDTSTFRKRLKNLLFDRAYNWLLLALLDESYSGALQISCWLIDWFSL